MRREDGTGSIAFAAASVSASQAARHVKGPSCSSPSTVWRSARRRPWGHLLSGLRVGEPELSGGVRTVDDLPLARSIRVGSIRIHALEAGLQRLDGGAMFGVVPKALWEQRIPADERNLIPLALRCLLIEAPRRTRACGHGHRQQGKRPLP